MNAFTTWVTSHTKSIVVITFVLAALCGGAAKLVPVNYNLVSYLPDTSESTQAIDLMGDEFTSEVPNARVFAAVESADEGREVKERLETIDGVTSVLWLDDVADLTQPLVMLNPETVAEYYKDGRALYSVTIEGGKEATTMAAIFDLVGDEGGATGEAVNTAESQNAAGSEVANAFAILIPLILALLIISTTSWIEPLYFLLAIGVSIVFNMGTNLFLGEVSYLAFTISPILQLAVSLDYAIFLLHAFQRARERTPDVVQAMREAMAESFSTVAASAATTTFGFAALGFMQFRIGADLGITLVKGIVFSFLCVMVFLPAFTLITYKAVDKTAHRRLMPSFSRIGRPLRWLRVPMLVFVCVAAVPCFLAQSHLQFTYGMGAAQNTGARSYADTQRANETFGRSTPLVLLVPKGDTGREAELAAKLEALPDVGSVLSYTTAVGPTIPVEFLDSEVTEQFYSENYARIVIYANTETEGDRAFHLVESVRADAAALYGEGNTFLAGEPASLYDMREVTLVDSRVTNTIAVIAIFLVLVLTFRSLLLPFILILTIESAIYINLAIPYFTGDSLNYLGFLVINTVQLGATVDYAILFTTTFLRYRQRMSAPEALFKTCGETFQSLIVSASILALAGLVLWLTSSNPIISILGLLLFRGTLLSLLMVLTFLPAMLRILDKPIGKTTWHARFFHPPAER